VTSTRRPGRFREHPWPPVSTPGIGRVAVPVAVRLSVARRGSDRRARDVLAFAGVAVGRCGAEQGAAGDEHGEKRCEEQVLIMAAVLSWQRGAWGERMRGCDMAGTLCTVTDKSVSVGALGDRCGGDQRFRQRLSLGRGHRFTRCPLSGGRFVVSAIRATVAQPTPTRRATVDGAVRSASSASTVASL